MSKLWLLLFALTPLLKGDVKQQIILPNDYEVIEENTFIANSPIPIYAKLYSAIADDVIDENEIDNKEYKKPQTYLVDDIKHPKTLECLISCESGGNENAINKTYVKGFGNARGLVQFMQSTFNHFCVNEYKLASESEYLNPEKQLLCCDRMVDNNLINHWECAKNCKGLD